MWAINQNKKLNYMEKIRLKYIAAVILILKASLVGFLAWKIYQSPENSFKTFAFDREFLIFLVAGFVAQIIDGALGMAYGVSCASLLQSFGIPQKLVTASVHTAEVFTTGVSGLSHIALGNIDKKLFFRLVISGVISAALAAVLISNHIDGNVIKPYISGYLLILGIWILIKSFRNIAVKEQALKYAPFLGFIGAFLDVIGGGGWGPIVTSNLIDKGKSPREVIGTVNTAEFFITFTSTGVFIFLVGIDAWKIILALILGGVIAAPFGAYILRLIQPKTLLRMVGILIIIVNAYTLYNFFLK
jgi:uncharacterized membrane protein YfcA